MFKDKLREARKAQKMTQKELSALLKVSDNAISNWEQGVSRPDIDQVAEICSILKVSPNYLIDSEEIETVISIDDKKILNKYHFLDKHGKKIVDMILNEEYNRCQTAQEQEQDNIINLPYYYGGVSAGTGIPSIDEYKVLRQVPRTALTEKADFIVQVNGDSMLPTFSDGDLLLIKSQQSVEVGEVGIFVVEGSEMYVKRFGGDRLIPDNKKYPDIPISEDTVCQGKVIGKL